MLFHTDPPKWIASVTVQIESLQFTFDGKDKFSFAEAAMLIQGSACIYSKKVAHVHHLSHAPLRLLAH